MRKELRGIQIEANVLAEALRLQQCGKKHEFISFLLVGLPLELQQIKFSCEMLYVKRGAVSITRLGAPEGLQLWLSILLEAEKREFLL